MKKYFLIFLGLLSFFLMFFGILMIFGSSNDRFWQEWGELIGVNMLPTSIIQKFLIYLFVMICGFVFMYCLDTIPKLFTEKKKRLAN